MAEVVPDIVLQTEIGDGQFSCQGFSGVPAATRSWICLVSSGSDESRASVAALSTELVAVLLGSSPAVVVSEVPGAEAPSAFDPSRYPDRHKVLVLVGSAKRPIPERSWYSTWHDAAGGTVMTALPPGAFLDMFDDAITRQDPQHWLLAINAARWQHHPAEVLASIMAVAEITSSASRVFISYRRLETQSLAVQLFDALTHEGFETFLDRFSIPVGLDFQRRLTQELEDKSMVVLLESRFLKDSKWTQHEVDFVKQYRLGLATLRMPDVRESDRLPSATIGRQLDLQASDFVRAPQLVPKADDPNTSMFEWPELRRDALERVVGEIKRAHADALFQRRYRLRDDLRIALRKAGLEPDEVIRRGAAGRVRRAHREAVVALNEGDVVFLSASVPTRRPFVDDAEPAEIEEAIVSVARAVFSRSGRMLFGGHPSVSPLIASIAGAYVAPDPDRPVANRPIVTFQSEHFKHQLPNETWELHSMGWSAIEWTPPIGDRRDDSLELMRRTMLDVAGFGAEAMARNQLRPPKVMIAIGGMEGILDEARILRESGRQTPIYAFVSGGGAAKRLVREVPGVHDLEAEFRVAHADYLPRGMRFPPYAAIAQWLLDRRIIDAVPD